MIKVQTRFLSLFEEKAEFELLVADDTGIGGFAFEVFFFEVIDDLAFIFLPQT